MPKYTRRERKPGGGYRYYYDEPERGPQQGGRAGRAPHQPHGGRNPQADPQVGDTVHARMPDGATKRVKLNSVAVGGFLGLVEGERNARRVTRWMISNADIKKATMGVNPLDLVKGNITLEEAGLAKAKYTRRERKPGGGYRYYYDKPGRGPQQGGAPKGGAPKAYHRALNDAHSIGWDAGVRSTLKEVASMHGISYGDQMAHFVQWAEKQLGLAKSGEPLRKPAATVSEEIRHLMRDKGYPQERAVATALEMQRRGKIAKADEEEEPEEEEEDPAEAEAEKEEEMGKSSMGPLDLVKAEPAAPRTMRIGSVTYHNVGGHSLDPIGSRPSLGRPQESAYEQHGRESVDPLNLVRMPSGVLTHPNGKTRVD